MKRIWPITVPWGTPTMIGIQWVECLLQYDANGMLNKSSFMRLMTIYKNQIALYCIAPTECKDNANWCPTIFPGYCYDRSTEQTCCKFCRDRLKSDLSECISFRRLVNKPIRHLGFRYRFWPKYKVTWTWIGRIDMSCAHAQWVVNGHCRLMKF